MLIAERAGPMVLEISARYPVTPLIAPVTSSRPKSWISASRFPTTLATAGPTLAKMLATSFPTPLRSSRTLFQSVFWYSMGRASLLPMLIAERAGPMVLEISARYPVTPLIAPVTSSRPKSWISASRFPTTLATAGPTLAKILATSFPTPLRSSRTLFQSVFWYSIGRASLLPMLIADKAGPMVLEISARYPVTPLMAPVTSSRPKSWISTTGRSLFLRSEPICL